MARDDALMHQARLEDLTVWEMEMSSTFAIYERIHAFLFDGKTNFKPQLCPFKGGMANT